MRAPVTHNPRVGDLTLLHHAVSGCTGLGVFVHGNRLYLHLVNEGEPFLIDVTGGGTLIGGRDYAAVMALAASSYERAAVSLAGLTARAASVEPVSEPDAEAHEEPVLPFMPADAEPLEAGSGDDTPEPLFDMGRAERKVIGSDEEPPLPEWLASATGMARPAEVVEGWD